MGKEKSSPEHINQTMNEQVSEQKQLVNPNEIKRQFESKDSLRYIKNDTYIADPCLLLGKVFYEQSGSDTLIPFLLSVEGKVNESSILKSPQTRVEMIIDAKAVANTGIMSYLSLSLEVNEVFEFRVIDNTAGRLIDRGSEWEAALIKWIANPLCKSIVANPNVGSIGIVTGVVQKYITTKKYRKFDGTAKGGGFGVNVGGELYTSSSEFALDIVYGLDIVYIPKVNSIVEFADVVEKRAVVQDKGLIRELNQSFNKLLDDRGFITVDLFNPSIG
jgi:hypothetical protein